jgi:hypothetical protein
MMPYYGTRYIYRLIARCNVIDKRNQRPWREAVFYHDACSKVLRKKKFSGQLCTPCMGPWHGTFPRPSITTIYSLSPIKNAILVFFDRLVVVQKEYSTPIF